MKTHATRPIHPGFRVLTLSLRFVGTVKSVGQDFLVIESDRLGCLRLPYTAVLRVTGDTVTLIGGEEQILDRRLT